MDYSEGFFNAFNRLFVDINKLYMEELGYDLNISTNTPEYHNFLVENPIKFYTGGGNESGDNNDFYVSGGASGGAISIEKFNNIDVEAFRKYASGGYLTNIKANLRNRTINLKNIPSHFLETVKKVSAQTGVPVGFFILIGASESGFKNCALNSAGYGGYFGQSPKNGVGPDKPLEVQCRGVVNSWKSAKAASPGAKYQDLLVLGYMTHHLPAVGTRYWKKTNGNIYSLDADYINKAIRACYSGGSATRYAEAIMISVCAQYISAQLINAGL